MATATMMKKLSLATAGAALMALGATVKAANAASIVNGGFETGNFSGWTVVNQAFSSGNFFNTAGGSAPLSGIPISGASEGTRYAVTDQGGGGSHVLFQDIFLEAGSQYQLSFDWFAQTSIPLFNPETMNAFGVVNQQFRVDIVSAGFSDWFDNSSSAGVLANILAPTVSPDRWTSTTFDLSAWAGQTVRLAFREVDNQNFFQAGVDNVKISSTPNQAVPEPASTLGLLALGAMGVGSTLKRKEQKNAG
ncbi:PEP-CTERM sorting domain-containing protein [Oscillatoria sp. FACHB-1406]|uniref:PEP-CTERM sorting domain-containing protein n=1 Tax=Oscillatoria sp. FACHB-1406 TaxID=2692846 RepID=UPI0016854252|nr:PEP-CTERM sorting domain-containing protein [Oscillatoria sp. FACHB-1406]MBD2580475.1 PEP-CTERM sorting domain-containing protein [Oscillatoria sp. FACHB-1406]